jgi:hypothetical protein
MTNAKQIQSRHGEGQMTLQTAKVRVVLRLETQDMCEARETIPTQGVGRRDISE